MFSASFSRLYFTILKAPTKAELAEAKQALAHGLSVRFSLTAWILPA